VTHPEEIKPLNLVDLDVEALEERLEMVQAAMDEGYYCGTDSSCGENGGGTVKPK